VPEAQHGHGKLPVRCGAEAEATRRARFERRQFLDLYEHPAVCCFGIDDVLEFAGDLLGVALVGNVTLEGDDFVHVCLLTL